MPNRKSFAPAAFAVFLLLAASCSKSLPEEEIHVEDTGTDVISLDLEQIGSTKLNLSEDKGTGNWNMVWGEADMISVVGTATTRFVLATGIGKTQGSFQGNMSKAGEGPYCAVFPYTDNVSISNGKLKFPIPQTVGAQNNNVATKVIPCVAGLGQSGISGPVGMHNLMGLLSVTLVGSGSVSIKKMSLHDLGGNMLWGDCTVPLDAAGNPDYEHFTLENGSNTISMVWNNPFTLNSTAKTYYFPVPPGSLDRGFSIVLYEKDDKAEDGVGGAYSFIQKVSSPIKAGRSVIISMDEATVTDKRESADVKRRGYYKSLFVDAGMFLSNNYNTSHIPAISYIGLSNDYEYFASHTSSALTGSTRINDSIFQRNIMVASDGSNSTINWKDANGVLVYPDGAPRFRCIYTNGGRSYDHGRSLAKDGRDRVHYYFTNGGSYTGSCAGSFLAATWVDGTKRYGHSNPASDWSYGLYPGELKHTHLPPSLTTYPESVLTGMKVLPRLKELGYFNFAKTDTLEDIRHHGGSYYPHVSRNVSYPVEELMSFQYSKKSIATAHRYNPDNKTDEVKYNGSFIKIADSVNTWAYKKNSTQGRLVVTGSHPEKGKTGNVRDFIAMMLLYAMDGNGAPKVKSGDLKLGVQREMSKTTADDDPDFTRIGDRQYHHFKFTTTSPTENFQLRLISNEGTAAGVDLYLALRKDDFAWLSDADYTICTKGCNKVLNIKNLPAGKWYVSVYCATTVNSSAAGSNPYYWNYTGKTEVLNGIPYTIMTGIGTSGIQAPDAYGYQDLGSDFDY